MESPQFHLRQEVQQHLQSSGTCQPRHSKLLVNYATHIRFCQPFTYGTCWFQVQVLYGNLVTTFKRVLVK
jgi:hypothetical protein